MALNPLLLQKQLRENSTDLHEFAKELKSWGDEMKRKENVSFINVSEPKVKKKIKKSTETKHESMKSHNKPASTPGSTNYAAWEKFDVEAELEKLDDDTKDDSELTDECNETSYDEAILEKEKGNKFVKSEKWDEAIKCYTKAIDCYSYEPIFYANRALCFLKKNMFVEAEKDCNLSLKLDQTYVKAYLRRAAARKGLNKLEYAELDYLRVLELEPNNKESVKELQNIRAGMNKDITEEQISELISKGAKQVLRPVSKFTASRKKTTEDQPLTDLFKLPGPTKTIPSNDSIVDKSKPSSTWCSEEEDMIFVKPINKQPHLRSQKPLKRIEIVEVGDDCPVKKVGPGEAVKKHVIENHADGQVTGESPKVIGNLSEKGTAEKMDIKGSVPSLKQHMRKIEILDTDESFKTTSIFKKQQATKDSEKTHRDTAWPKPNSQTANFKSDDFKIIENKNPKDEKNFINIVKTHSFGENWVYPKNSVQFCSAWKNMKSEEEKYLYLRTIDPKDLPNIFLNSLESGVFSSIIDTMVSHFIKEKTYVSKLLHYLSEVKRFSAITMFLTKEDKSNLQTLFDYIREINEMDEENVNKLIQKYEL